MKIEIVIIIFLIFSVAGCTFLKKETPTIEQKSYLLHKNNKLYDSFIPTSDDKKLVHSIRRALAKNSSVNIPESSNFSFQFNPKYSWVSITLYQPEHRSLRYISKRDTLEETIDRIISKLKERDRFSKFKVTDPSKVRI